MKEQFSEKYVRPLVSRTARPFFRTIELPYENRFIDGVAVNDKGIIQAGLLVLHKIKAEKTLEHAATNVRIDPEREVMFAGIIIPPKETDLVKAVGDSLRLYARYAHQTEIGLPILAFTYSALAKASSYFGFTTLDTAPLRRDAFISRLEYYADNPRYLAGKPYKETKLIYMASETLRKRYLTL